MQVDNIKQPRTVKTSLTTDAGFPIKDARFLKLKNISGLLSDGKEGKSKENMLAIGRFFFFLETLNNNITNHPLNEI